MVKSLAVTYLLCKLVEFPYLLRASTSSSVNGVINIFILGGLESYLFIYTTNIF